MQWDVVTRLALVSFGSAVSMWLADFRTGHIGESCRERMTDSRSGEMTLEVAAKRLCVDSVSLPNHVAVLPLVVAVQTRNLVVLGPHVRAPGSSAALTTEDEMKFRNGRPR